MKKTLLLVATIIVLGMVLSACGNKASPIDDFEYEMHEGSVTITKYKGTDLKIYIPSQINERPVTKIGEDAFAEYDMTHITIPDSVKEILDNAFKECKCLESVKFSKSLESIGIRAFSECEALKEINLPQSLKEIKKSAFSSCTNLVNINFPQKLESIGESAFEECMKLDKVKLPTELKYLESNAFAFCETLKKLEIPDNTQMSIGTSERSVGYVGYMITFFSPVGGSHVTYYSEQYQYAQGSVDFDELPTVLVVSDGSYAHNQLIGFEGYGLKFDIK